ncbi:MAG TPA: selenoneine biosynthesis selenosugar synthase SenB, partial [Burkholderiales bacterium]|nr:selenoneine biosynthesis selenosugar synthase SenB [Burkholderiales bacterium]
LMIALHARRSHASMRNYVVCCPDQPLILALTGTDLYHDIRTDGEAQASMQWATRMIVLQEMGLAELAPVLRRKTRVVYQSAQAVQRPPPLKSCFEVIVSGHLRDEKDPFRAAAALACLPKASRIRITHVGGAMSSEMAQQAKNWMAREQRYHWLGEVTRGKALRLLARSRLMVISSRLEGGANVVSEALANNVPVIASRIPGNVGMLGKDYAGYYALEDERALARVLTRAETDRRFYQKLASQCHARRPRVTHASERNALQRIIAEIL